MPTVVQKEGAKAVYPPVVAVMRSPQISYTSLNPAAADIRRLLDMYVPQHRDGNGRTPLSDTNLEDVLLSVVQTLLEPDPE